MSRSAVPNLIWTFSYFQIIVFWLVIIVVTLSVSTSTLEQRAIKLTVTLTAVKIIGTQKFTSGFAMKSWYGVFIVIEGIWA